MATSLTKTQQRITDLLNSDSKTGDLVHSYYRDALEKVRSNLLLFYIRYADETGLSVSQVQARANQWDVAQFEAAIALLDVELAESSSDTKDKAKTRRAKAIIDGHSHNRQLVMMGTMTATVLTVTTKVEKALSSRLRLDLKDETKYHKLPRSTKRTLKASAKDYTTNLSESIWNGNDALNAELHYLVNKNLAGKGLTSQDFSRLFPYMKRKGIKPGTITNSFHLAEYHAMNAVKWWSAAEVDDVTMASLKRQHVRMVNIVNEPGACMRCNDLADAGPYPIDDCPSLPAHGNCRCHKESADRPA